MEPEEYERLRAVEDDHPRFVALRRLLRTAIRRWGPTSGGAPTILDAGCGTGGTTADLGRLGLAAGADVALPAVRACAARGLRIVRADVAALPFASERFDVVVSVDALHQRGVPDDRAALAEMARVCRGGGLVFVVVPAFDWLRRAHDRRTHGARRYTPARIERLARAAGLEVLHAGCFLVAPLAAVISARLLPGVDGSEVRPVPRAFAAAMRPWLAAEADLALRVRLPIGVSVVCAMQRPLA